MYTDILVYPSEFYDRPSRDVSPRHLFTTARQCVGVGEIIIVEFLMMMMSSVMLQ